LSDKKAVLAIFENEAAADGAAESLKKWDKADDRIKLNAVGVLVLDKNGEVKTQKMGPRSIAKGGGIGLVLALLVPPVGLTAGVVGGGLLGALHRKGLGLNEQDQDRIGTELADGKAAVGVLANTDEADAIMAKMEELGGQPEVHAVSDAALQQAAEEIPPETPPATPST
jgi:uncharacterized membrane protein